jgi:hypothetical protein
MTEETNKQVTEPMGRPPIHDTPMSGAERQRRRRHRMRSEPWNDPRSLAWALVAAVRGIRADEKSSIPDETLAVIIARATDELTADSEGDEAAEATVAALTLFLDPDQPLPERRKGGRHGGRGHRGGERHHRRREGRRTSDDS